MNNVLEGGRGVAVHIPQGAAIRIVNTHGTQTVDFWALSAAEPAENVSMEQTRRMLYHLYPGEGDVLWSNRRTKMLEIEKDTAPGHHDTLFDCCDEWVYANYGCPPGHRSCRENFSEALAEAGLLPREAPRPLNLWMNVAVQNDGHIAFGQPTARAGDEVVLRALVDTVAVLSACPMDVTPVNGGDGTPKDIFWEILPATKQS